jgi:hypothetical protein
MMIKRLLHHAGLALAGSASLASATTFTVLNTNDSGAGSLRQAIQAVNASAGPHQIQFAIPGTSVHTIAPLTALPGISNTVSLDGYSQPGSRPNTLADGDNALLRIRLDGTNLTSTASKALAFYSGGNSVRGLVIVRFPAGLYFYASSANVVAGNWVGLDVDGIARGQTFNGIEVTCAVFNRSTGNVIGGTTPADRNVISGNWRGISFSPWTADHNTVQGNCIGTDATGTLPRGNLFAGIEINNASNIVVGGTSPAARNVIAACTAAGGSGVSILSAANALVQGNFIGTDVTGAYDLGHSSDGIYVNGGANAIIGGTAAGAGNRIVNNRAHGIRLGGCTGAVVQGNLIGTDATGARPLGNANEGIYLFGASTNLIGGPGVGAGNVIQFNGGPGVSVSAGSGNRILANRIFDNAGLGIDLGADGPTANDAGDPDTGANHGQNYPVLTGATSTYGAIQIQGTLNSLPNTVFRLEFFASPAWDPAWIAEGESYLGTTNVLTDAAGNAAFSVLLPLPASADDLVTATATDPAGNTSEFSAGIFAMAGPQTVGLTISRGGDTLKICWPSGATFYHLQTTSCLTPAISWQAITTGITDDGQVKCFVLTNGAAPQSQFFRLKMN